jgi:hypothetical protein
MLPISFTYSFATPEIPDLVGCKKLASKKQPHIAQFELQLVPGKHLDFFQSDDFRASSAQQGMVITTLPKPGQVRDVFSSLSGPDKMKLQSRAIDLKIHGTNVAWRAFLQTHSPCMCSEAQTIASSAQKLGAYLMQNGFDKTDLLLVLRSVTNDYLEMRFMTKQPGQVLAIFFDLNHPSIEVNFVKTTFDGKNFAPATALQEGLSLADVNKAFPLVFLQHLNNLMHLKGPFDANLKFIIRAWRFQQNGLVTQCVLPPAKPPQFSHTNSDNMLDTHDVGGSSPKKRHLMPPYDALSTRDNAPSPSLLRKTKSQLPRSLSDSSDSFMPDSPTCRCFSEVSLEEQPMDVDVDEEQKSADPKLLVRTLQRIMHIMYKRFDQQAFDILQEKCANLGKPDLASSWITEFNTTHTVFHRDLLELVSESPSLIMSVTTANGIFVSAQDLWLFQQATTKLEKKACAQNNLFTYRFAKCDVLTSAFETMEKLGVLFSSFKMDAIGALKSKIAALFFKHAQCALWSSSGLPLNFKVIATPLMTKSENSLNAFKKRFNKLVKTHHTLMALLSSTLTPNDMMPISDIEATHQKLLELECELKKLIKRFALMKKVFELWEKQAPLSLTLTIPDNESDESKGQKKAYLPSVGIMTDFEHQLQESCLEANLELFRELGGLQ